MATHPASGHRTTTRTARLRALVRWLAAASATALAACSSDGPDAPRLRLHPCFVSEIRELARCGTFRVPEQREPTGTVRRWIALHVVVLPARGVRTIAAPVALLQGGPGVGATEAPGYAVSVLAGVRRSRDILLVDQRGTGDSHALRCGLYEDDGRSQPYLDPIFPLGAVRRCRDRLVPREALDHYTTADAADDLDELRAALGVDRLDLFGVSYGTRAALVYLRRYPTRVRSMVLQGVVAPDEPIPLAAGRAGQRAIEHLADVCAADASCHADVPDPLGDVRQVMDALHRAPAELTLWRWRGPSHERVRLTARGFAERLWSMLYDPGRDLATARLVHAAARGDVVPFARAALRESRRRRQRSEGMMLSVLCSEDAPRLARADTTAAAAGTLLGLPIAEELLRACDGWPRRPIAVDDTSAASWPTPTLLLSGEVDPVAPPEWAERARQQLPNGVHLVQPGRGHGDLDDCTRGLIADVLTYADPRRVAEGCLPVWSPAAGR
ncbi:MAG: alpha/beta fold hydrolase [Gemmatirosa sp.]|nr:alpha/beta fold hydrolase [Gemmatirosa sp.]